MAKTEAQRARKREYDRAWWAANPEYQRNRRKANPEAAREYSRTYRVVNPEKNLASHRKWWDANPDKLRVHRAVKNAIRDGRLERQSCKVCGATEHIHAHHEDYSKPLDVVWLCAQHHKEVHRVD